MKMDNNYKNISKCLLCKSESLSPVFSAENIALTGFFPNLDELDRLKTPITLMKCEDCSNIQMKELVNKDQMFQDYWYRSGTTKSMKNHFEYIADIFGNFKDKSVLDIGCNDCTFLQILEKRGAYDLWGFEPSVAFADRKIQSKKIINDFFPPIKSVKMPTFDYIFAISMFYDVERPIEFLKKCKEHMHEKSSLVIEVNYAKLFFERGNVDMLGQEHLIYYSIDTFKKICESSGLYLNDFYINDMNGGNIIFICNLFEDESSRLADDLVKEEVEFFENFDFQNFQLKIDSDFQKLLKKINQIKESNKNIKIYGASTRGAFIAQYLGLDNKLIDSAVDVQENKNNKRIPGTNIRIEMENVCTPPDYYLIFPYQFLDEFIEKNITYLEAGGKFITFRPFFEEISMKNGELIRVEY